MTFTCTQCSAPVVETNEAQRYRFKMTGRIYCTHACGYAHRPRRGLLPRLPGPPCCMCGGPTPPTPSVKTGRVYCGKACSGKYRALRSSETMTKTNRTHASARMRANNPMHDPANREAVSKTLKAMGYAPVTRGGNGRPPTMAEKILWIMLTGQGFVLNAAIRTRAGRGSGFPTVYKPDLTHWGLKISIEADGASHAGKRKVLDAKKDAFLNGLGWTVLRFTNEMIYSDPGAVLMTVTSTTSRLRACTPT